MADVFGRMADREGFSREDLEDFLRQIRTATPGELGAVFGYLLGRLDSGDAQAMVETLRNTQQILEIPKEVGQPTVSMVGTGGGPSTFNITTTASFVVTAAGPLVVKVGSNAWRSKSGSSDVAAKLGVMPIRISWEDALQVASEAGMVFIPSSYYPPILARLAHGVTMPTFRRVCGFINILGPLLSPVNVDHRFIGARSSESLEMLAKVCCEIGDLPATFFSSQDGMDEVSTMAATDVLSLNSTGESERSTIYPAQLGISRPSLEDLAGYEAEQAADCCIRILSGKGTPAQSQIVALNAGVVLHTLGLYPTLQAGYDRALDILKHGEGLRVLESLRKSISNV